MTERMAQAARDLRDGADPLATLQAAVRIAATNVGGCDAAGISVRESDGRLHTPAYTDELALAADTLQYELDEGPCLEAVREQGIVHGADLAADPRWPAWAPRVVEEYGARSVLCLRLVISGDPLGVLTLYARTPDAFGEEERDEAISLAAHIAVAVAAARREDELTEALGSRTVIAQACGILMERYQLDAGRAFQVLVRVSSQTHVKVRDIAAELVETGDLREAVD